MNTVKIDHHVGNWKAASEAELHDDRIELLHDAFGQQTREIINMREALKDKAIRAWLIKEGWTPPEGDNQ